jgi:replicative DNA helicase
MKTVEKVLLAGLLTSKEYAFKVLPFLKSEYFQANDDRKIFETIESFVEQYKNLPSITALQVMLDGDSSIGEAEFEDIQNTLRDFDPTESTDEKWLVDQAEAFCRDRALYNAIVQSLKIAEGKDKVLSRDSIPQVLQDALAVSFDTEIGHDYIEDAEKRFDLYHEHVDRIPFGVEALNRITRGGVLKKTLNVVIAGTGVGKSIFLCDYAASCISMGKNVLYITLEMAQERIAERIDANLLNVTTDELMDMDRTTFLKRINSLRSKSFGVLKIKEYPTGSAHVGHFRALLNELKTKQKFVPEIIIVDYINICASSRYKPGANANSYTIVKAIAEELRGLGMEYNAAVFSATQPTRTGMGSSDMELQDTSESIGLPQTADFMFALITNEELERMNQILAKQLKNRYDKITAKNRRFIIGLDKDRMRFFDTEASAQTLIQEEHEPLVERQKVFRPKNKP